MHQHVTGVVASQGAITEQADALQRAPSAPQSPVPVLRHSPDPVTGDPAIIKVWRDPFTGRRLRARFRWAAILMLLPLLGMASVSGVGLMIGATTLAKLDRAQQLTDQLSGLDEDVQFFALSVFDVVIGHAGDDLTRMTAAEKQVGADFAALVRTPGLTRAQADAVLPIEAAWTATLALRSAITGATPANASALGDSLFTQVQSLISSVTALEAVGSASVDGLHQQRDNALRTSAITIGAALLLGIAIALWLSSKLAQSVLRPVRTLMQAIARVAAGDLRHRVAIGSGDEIAELGEAFDTMAGQLEEERDAVLARERRLGALVENASDGIVVLGRDRTIDFATPSFQEYLDSDGVPGRRLNRIIHPDDLERISAAWGQALSASDGSTLDVEGRLKHRDGSWHHVRAKLTNRFNDPAVAGMVLNISDITERHEHERELNFQALHDTLTGLPNRKLLRHRLEDSGSASEHGEERVNSVLFLDIDDFKTINDTMGHQAGDDFLVAMAQRLLAAVRPQDTVARLGGDEYGVLLEGTDSAHAESVAQHVLTALEQPLTLEGRHVAPHASVGIASAMAGAGSPETLLADADLAMYFAKRMGKAQYQVFSAEMRSDLLDRLQLGEDLRAAVESGDIEVHYQRCRKPVSTPHVWSWNSRRAWSSPRMQARCRHSEASRHSDSTWPSTTSAPATRRSHGCARCPSTRSRSTRSSSTSWPTATRNRRWQRASSTWRGYSASRWLRRESKHPCRQSFSAAVAATSPRATSSAARSSRWPLRPSSCRADPCVFPRPRSPNPMDTTDLVHNLVHRQTTTSGAAE